MGGIELNEAWLAVSAVAGLVVSLVAVWRIVVRATGRLRDEFKEEIRILRENDLRHLEKGIKGLDARMSRVEERIMERLTGSEERMIERLTGSEERMIERLTGSEERMMERLTGSEERMMERLNRVEERNAISFRELKTDLKDTRTELLEAIRFVSATPEAAVLAPPP